MDSKSIRKDIAYFSGWLGINLSYLIIRVIPGSWLYIFAAIIGRLGYTFARKQKRIAFDSLQIAFGSEKSGQQIKQIARDCFTFMAKAALELMFLMDRPTLLRQRAQITGKDKLEECLAKGKGVILVSAHFGNFPLMLAKLALEGYDISGIMRQMKDSRVEKIFMRQRNRLNIKTIYSQPRRTCVDTTIRQLRNNGIVFIPIDQNFGTAGVFVDFFGRKAATATGPVVLAQRTKAAILPCFILRQKDDTHRIVFEEPLTLEEETDSQDVVSDNIQKLTSIIESYIRRYPAEWGWIHRRWKSKMKEV
jgi:KDO2-lipid IV(A) lauroyltransferase